MKALEKKIRSLPTGSSGAGLAPSKVKPRARRSEGKIFMHLRALHTRLNATPPTASGSLQAGQMRPEGSRFARRPLQLHSTARCG